MLFGDMMKQARLDAGLTVYQTAKRSLISQTQVSRYETGGARPPLDRLEKLCRLYELDFEHVAEEWGFE